MPARKQTILAFGLVAVVCLVVGFFAGQEYVSHKARSAAQRTPSSSSGTPASPITSVLHSPKSASNVTDAVESAASARPQAAKLQYIQQDIELYDLHAQYMNLALEGKVPTVTFKIKNKGTRTLIEVDVTIYFKNANGRTISEASYKPVFATDSSVSKRSYAWRARRLSSYADSENCGGSHTSLKPGYIWKGSFCSAKSVPSEWKPGSVSAKITGIEFASPPSKSDAG